MVERSLPYSTVVVGVDGSLNSVVALRWAFLQLRARPASLHVVLVWERLPPSATSQAWTIQGRPRSEASARRFLETALREVFGEAGEGVGSLQVDGVTVTAELREGAPGPVLCEVGRAADLLVVGAVGRRRVKGLFLGSVMRYVTAHAICPVAVVRPPVGRASALPAEPIGV